MLNIIYYPVSIFLWFWWRFFGLFFGVSTGVTWIASIVSVTLVLRVILYWPFRRRIRSLQRRPASARSPESFIRTLRPLGGWPIFVIQVLFFVGIHQVLQGMQAYKIENYVFSRSAIIFYNESALFGMKFGASVVPVQGRLPPTAFSTTPAQMLIVAIPLTVTAAVLLYYAANRTASLRTELGLSPHPTATAAAKLILPLMPLITLLFWPTLLLFYWISNSICTIYQCRLVRGIVEPADL